MEEVEWPDVRSKVKLQDHSIKTLGNKMQTERLYVHLLFLEEVEWPDVRSKVKLQDHSIKTLGNKMQTEGLYVHLLFLIHSLLQTAL